MRPTLMPMAPAVLADLNSIELTIANARLRKRCRLSAGLIAAPDCKVREEPRHAGGLAGIVIFWA
jgi:hypothetical protein